MLRPLAKFNLLNDVLGQTSKFILFFLTLSLEGDQDSGNMYTVKKKKKIQLIILTVKDLLEC